MWSLSTASDSKSHKKAELEPSVAQLSKKLHATLKEHGLDQFYGVIAGFGAASTLAAGYVMYARYFKRFPTAEHVPLSFLANRRTLRGVVTRVGDGDNFRFFHKPLPFVYKVPQVLAKQTMSIRLSGVDAPEMSHFGQPAQPYAQEALTWLTKELTNRTVSIKLLRQDQYKRLVCAVQYRKWPDPRRRDVCAEMLKAGLAEVYTGSDAIFRNPSTKQYYMQLEEQAKKAKKGMWVQKHYISPAIHKKGLNQVLEKKIDGKIKSTRKKPDSWFTTLERRTKWITRL